MPAYIALLLGAYVVTVWKKPYWGIYLILAFLPVYQVRFSFAKIPTTLLEWMILLLAAMVLFKLFMNKDYRLEISKKITLAIKIAPGFFATSALLLLAGLISVFVSPHLAKALGLYKAYYIEGFLFLSLFWLLIDSREKFWSALKALVVLVVYLSVFGILQLFTLYRLPPAWWGPGLEPRRIVSFYTYPNATSLLIAPVLGLYAGLLIFFSEIKAKLKGETPLSRRFLLWVNGLGTLLLILTFSRGAWIGYVAAIGFLSLFSRYKKYVFASLLVTAIAITIIPATRNRLAPLISGTDPASFERVKLYSGAWEIIQHSPLTGAGLYGFRDAYEQVKKSESDEILNYPHNFFLNFWVETGFVGVAAATALVMIAFWQAIRLYKTKPELRPVVLSICSGLVVLLVHGQVDAPFFKNDLSLLFWLFVGAIPYLNFLQKKDG